MRPAIPPLSLVCECGATWVLEVPPADDAVRVVKLVCPYCHVGQVRIARVVKE